MKVKFSITKYLRRIENVEANQIEIPCLTGTQKKVLIESAEQTALRFCSPVYLVGSAIWRLYPNDIDIFVAVKSDTYLRLFTNYNKKTESEENHLKNMTDMKLQQAKIYKKQKEYFEKKIKGWDFDIKFQDIRSFNMGKGEKVRLDKIYQKIW